jgi:hypothetical protein
VAMDTVPTGPMPASASQSKALHGGAGIRRVFTSLGHATETMHSTCERSKRGVEVQNDAPGRHAFCGRRSACRLAKQPAKPRLQ